MATRQIISKSINVDSATYVGKDGELWVDTDTNLLKISDGVTAGGAVITTDSNQWKTIHSTTNGFYGIAIGTGSAQDGYGITVGQNSQADSYGVTVGAFAGTKHVDNNTAYTVAIGAYAQQNSPEGDETGTGAIAIGTLAGNTNQGANAVAIGRYAGRNNQAAKSIVINATDANLENTTADTFVVKPVRGEAGATLPAGFKQVAYNPTTGEFIYYDM